MDGQLSEGVVRLAVFLSVFVAMALLELLSPRLERPELAGALKSRRWLANLSLVVLSSVMVRLIFPAAAVGVAIYAETKGWGLLRWLEIDPLVGGLIAFVVLDFAVWLEHLASHKIPVLWRIHRVHHTDTGLDVTTGLRFHPLEIVISMVWKSVLVVLLGPPVVAVLIFEIVLNATSMFNHANVRLPDALDRIVRLFLVTPDMHRVHHSTIRQETDSNYGFNLPLWDRVFGTYVSQPRDGHHAMGIGLDDERGPEVARIDWLVFLPFRRQKKLNGK